MSNLNPLTSPLAIGSRREINVYDGNGADCWIAATLRSYEDDDRNGYMVWQLDSPTHQGATIASTGCWPSSTDRVRKIGVPPAAALEMLDELLKVRSLITEAAMTGFNCKDGDWAERLFANQANITNAINKATGSGPKSCS